VSLKQDWSVSGTVTLRDRTQEVISDRWPSRTMEEADGLADQVVAAQMRRRNVVAVSVAVTAQGKAGHSIIVRQQWK